ncbi:pyridoxamine 5'-phosphate oxidase family protein [Acaricomes phytoseiuli]|uniref:pyridoxamine 5'-phosphate oxidase family protein n=1 Tax=Acaricomes phytoseiuli TaxID=291968 RepID=UPI00036A7BE5|nr:pyridoxamine 5'-phosphate oxidase family protein [Acaricomes phytoseiuli]
MPAMKKTDDHSTEYLPEHVCWSLLREGEVARIAFCTDQGVEIIPVNFTVDHGSIVLRTDLGGVLENILNPITIALEADGFNAYGTIAWSVVLKGRATLVTNTLDLLDTAALPLLSWQAGAKSAFIRIEPVSITGRRFPIRLPATQHYPD